MKKARIKKIVFILTDTLRAQNLGLYGQKPSKTPYIDSLGKNGIIFENAYTTITKTDPAVTSIMTGLYPVSSGLINHGPNITREEEKNLANVPFLAEILKSHGFKTAAVDFITRWHKRGYDYYSGPLQAPNYHLIIDKTPFFYLGFLDKLSVKIFKREFFLRLHYSFAKSPNIPYDPADIIVNKAIEQIKKNKSDKLFLYLHFWDAHIPHTKSKGFKSYLFDNIEKTYEAEIGFLDKEIGRLIGYLDKTRQLNETLIILTSDHGENFYEHHMPFNHEGLYEDVVHIPLILKHPSLPTKRVAALVQHVDLFPTILDLTGIHSDPKIDGKSLRPLIFGTKRTVRNFVYFEDIVRRKFKVMKNARRRGLMIENYKYIETFEGGKKDLAKIIPGPNSKITARELYDLEKDSSEKTNLINQKTTLASKMENQLEQIIHDSIAKHMRNKDLEAKIAKTISTVKKAVQKFAPEKIAIAFKGGKDTTVLMHIIRSMYGKIPFKAFFNDTTLEFRQTYEFIEKIRKLWNLDLVIIKHSTRELEEFRKTKDSVRKKELTKLMKITAINKALKKYKFKAFMAGIRRDEHEARAKETYFSKRSDHTRIHPLLHFTEKDIWDYIHLFGVPYSKLYDKGYRSVGEKLFTKASSKSERSGRDQEKEQVMAKLRKMGYW